MLLRRIGTIFSPLLLVALVATIGAGVERYARPPGGLQLPAPTKGYGDFRVRIASLTYPRRAIDSDGIALSIARPTHRIASQYWSIDEYAYSVAPAQEIVAVSQSAYLKAISNVYENVERFHPAVATDPERIVALGPDLLLVSSSGRADYTSLARSAGVPVYRFQTTIQTLDQVEQSIRLTGYLTGNDAAAQAEALHFHDAIEKAAARRPRDAPKPRILGLGGHYAYGRETLFHDIVLHLGGINVAAENGLAGYDSVNLEQIIRWDPEWIVTGAEPGKTTEVLANLLAVPGISLTQAARNGHIVVLQNHILIPMSPYTAALVEAMADSIYGIPNPSVAKSHE